MGAVILNGARVGAGAVVGAGAMVLQGREIPAGMLAIGAPAKVVRRLKEGELDRFRGAVGRYLKLAEMHGNMLKHS